MGESNHNVSYDTTENNTIMSHASVNENSKKTYACAKPVKSKLGFELKKKRKPNKKKTKFKINIEKKIETMRGEMLILCEIKIQNQKKPESL